MEFSLLLQYAVITSFVIVTFSSIELNFKRRECSNFRVSNSFHWFIGDYINNFHQDH